MRVALVHYWLVGMRGGEKVLEALCELFPEADIYTHVHDAESISATINRHRIHTSFIAGLPRAKRWYQRYLPFMPLALEQFDLRGYDLVISSESGPAKGVIVAPDATHICYCHSPMRYLWDMYHDYLDQVGPVTRLLMRPLLHRMRMWDVTSAARVDHFIANSAWVAARIRKYWRREAEVIPPPVETRDFAPSAERGDFYLCVGQLVGYKRVDLAVEAFRRLDRRLVVIGEGEQSRRLRETASPNVEFLGWQSFASIRDHYARCRALIFPGVEDFGIVPVEAMASGRPVIAYRKGGALESVREDVTGLFFDAQTPEALAAAVRRFEEREASFDAERIVAHARGFDREVFKQRIADAVARAVSTPRGGS